MAVTLDAEARPGVDVAERAVAATLRCIARSGLSKLTVDDVAREAGASRATIYRAFPSKQALVGAALASESDRIGATVAAAAAAATDLDDAVTRVIVVGTRELRECGALAFVAAHEPELLYPHLEFTGGDRLFAELGRRLAPLFAPWCADAERAAEWVARVALSLHWSSAPLVDPTDGEAVHRFVARFVTPGITVPAPVPSPLHPEEVR